jgi:hypothetical protein
MGYVDPDHTIGAMNDKAGKEPSLDMLQRAAKAAGFEFDDCLRKPKKYDKPMSPEHKKIHARLQDVLDRDDDRTSWALAALTVAHRTPLDHFLRR